MKDKLSLRESGYKILLPIFISLVLICTTVMLCGSRLYTIEDVYVNRILAGTYGEPDWRVLNMNPLLSQALAGLYRVSNTVNWYGLLMLVLLGLSYVLAMSHAAKQQWGMLPVAMIFAPVAVLLINAVHSTAVCAVCTACGMLTLMDGVIERKAGKGILGSIVLVFGAMLNLLFAAVLCISVLLCMVPNCLRDRRITGMLKSLPIIVVILLALFGYARISESSDTLKYYRENSQRYDLLQNSSFRENADWLLDNYNAMSIYYSVDDEENYDALIEYWKKNYDQYFRPMLGWTIDDVSIFAERKASDTELVSPDVLKTAIENSSFIKTDFQSIKKDAWNTIKKPQFILLIAVYLLCTIAVLITRPNRILTTIITTLLTVFGHIFMLMLYRDSFAYIAPFYLSGICVMLYNFSGDSARSWADRRMRSMSLRRVFTIVACIVFIGAIGGFMYYEANYTVNNAGTEMISRKIYTYTMAHPDTLFIGDNPCERIKPNTLEVPVMGQDANILAGSYDQYSPRATALKEKYQVTNPLPASFNNDNIEYISMSFYTAIRSRIHEYYNKEYSLFETMLSDSIVNNNMIMKITTFDNEEDYNSYISEIEGSIEGNSEELAD